MRTWRKPDLPAPGKHGRSTAEEERVFPGDVADQSSGRGARAGNRQEGAKCDRSPRPARNLYRGGETNHAVRGGRECDPDAVCPGYRHK